MKANNRIAYTGRSLLRTPTFNTIATLNITINPIIAKISNPSCVIFLPRNDMMPLMSEFFLMKSSGNKNYSNLSNATHSLYLPENTSEIILTDKTPLRTWL